MHPTYFLLGLPNSRSDHSENIAVEQGSTRITANFTGVLPILPFVMDDAAMRARSRAAFVGVHQLQIPSNQPVNFFNLVGDADSSSEALHQIQVLANRIRSQRFFNQPSHVFRTSRERLPDTLANIKGCIVPRVQAVNPADFDELQAACMDFATWPLIVRARGCHNGRHLFLARQPEQLEAIRTLSWPYEGAFLIRFHDYIDACGLYQKNRVIMIDGQPYPRHSIISDQWAINANRADLMDQEPALRAWEQEFLADFRDSGLTMYQRVFSAIHQRIGLDVFGIDFAVIDDNILVFEANACMSFLRNSSSDDDRYQYLGEFITPLRRALKRLLLKA